jgi:hypothetical protein
MTYLTALMRREMKFLNKNAVRLIDFTIYSELTMKTLLSYTIEIPKLLEYLPEPN